MAVYNGSLTARQHGGTHNISYFNIFVHRTNFKGFTSLSRRLIPSFYPFTRPSISPSLFLLSPVVDCSTRPLNNYTEKSSRAAEWEARAQ